MEGGHSQGEVGEWAMVEFKFPAPVSQARVSRYVSNHKGLSDMTPTELISKRVVDVTNKELDDTLAAWVLSCEKRGACVSGHIIVQKGEELAKTMKPAPTFSSGWLSKFINRHKLKSVRMSGEAGSTNQAAMQAVLPILQHRVAQFDPNDVYNMDETGL